MKQIIVMRSDLRNTEGHKVRSGKLMAQAAHASLSAILPYAESYGYHDYTCGNHTDPGVRRRLDCVREWLDNSFTKVVLKVDTLTELRDIHRKAVSAGLIVSAIIVDNGTTEFGGVPTPTCCAIGPDTEENLRAITGHLRPM